MRVLFTTWAWPSHYLPMVPLAWALRSAGHEVRMASQPDLLPTMRASGLPSTVIGQDVDVAALFRGAGRPAGAPVPAAAAAASAERAERIGDDLLGDLSVARAVHDNDNVRELADEARSTFRTLWADRALARSWQPDLIVYDALTHAGPLVAKLVGVPAVRSLFGPDVTYFLSAVGEAGLAPLLDRFGLDDLDLLGAASVDSCPPSLQFPDTIAPTHRIRIQYIPYNGLPDFPTWLLEPPPRPRICLTWGTSADRLYGDQAFLPGDVLLGAAKLAGDRGADLLLAITSGQRRLLPELPPHVRAVESVALDALLPTCQLIIHQGGAGTTFTALRHGLPQVVLPQLVDQASNACRLVATGAGRTRAVPGLSAADLLAAGHDVLDKPAYRLAAERLRAEILRQPTPVEVVDDLTALT
jgi:UDP:flavonoid glycosyltransferase YjiC (YdhE family)